jgi:CRP-like cAMP-binding protein
VETSVSTLGRYRSTLSYPDLRRLLGAFTLIEMGSWAYTIVIAAYLYAETGSAKSVATLAAVRWITGLVVNPYAGVVADRYDRRALVTVCALCTGATLGVMTLLVANGAPIWTILVTAALMAFFQAPNRPADSAMIPEIVAEKDLVTANVLINVLENLFIIVGPLMGGLLILTGNTVAAIAANAGGYVLAAGLYWSMSIRSVGDAEDAPGVVRQWVAGISALAGRPYAMALAMCSILSAALYGPELVFFAELTSHLDLREAGYSSFFAASAVGGVVIALLADRMASSSYLSLLVVGCLMLQGLPYVGIGLTNNYQITLAVLVLSGAGLVMVDVIALTALQRAMPNGVMGRTMATVTAGALLAATGSITAAGFTIERWGIERTLIGAGLAFPGLALLLLPLLMRGEKADLARTTAIGERADFIEKLGLFDGLSRTGIESLALAAHALKLPVGHVLIGEGDEPDYLWLLQSGVLGISTERGRTQMPSVTAPAWVGELGLLRSIPCTATVTLESECELLRIPGDQFLNAITASSASSSLVNLASDRLGRVGAGSESREDEAMPLPQSVAV